MQRTQERLIKGMVAGLVGGLVATAAKTFSERMAAAQKREGDSSESGKSVREEAIPWAFGAAAGLAYGALAEFYPVATGKEGASFGLALLTLTHEGAPALGLPVPEPHETLGQGTSEVAKSVMYGVVTERVRKYLREKWLR